METAEQRTGCDLRKDRCGWDSSLRLLSPHGCSRLAILVSPHHHSVHACCVCYTGPGRCHSIPTAQNCFTMDLDAELESGKVNLVFCILVLTTCVV